MSIAEPGARTISELPRQLEDFRRRGIDVRIMFLEAKTGTLINRFSETRRRHPLYDGVLTLPECIERERELLSSLAELATASTPAISPPTFCATG